MNTLLTRWGRNLDPEHVLEDYPRPGMKRDSYHCLNGYWEYSITQSLELPGQYEGRILVPFSPEAVLSGVNRTLLPGEILHYRRTFLVEGMGTEGGFSDSHEGGKRLLLHFGAVDQSCNVYVNGRKAGEHTGGYLAFSLDITQLVHDGENVLQLSVWDLTDSSYEARGKQSLERGGMWYTPQSGIWQTVWMEYVPARYIAGLTLVPDVDNECLHLQVYASDRGAEKMHLTVRLEDEVVLEADGVTSEECVLSLKPCRLWSPEEPVLYDLQVSTDEDQVNSYFAMRKISLERDSKGMLRTFLNGKPYYQNGVLDQGYYPDGLYTPPSDEAMVEDILQMKALGFNMLRKHVKIEPDRWYYHCDRLGMLVWQDMVNGGEWFRGKIKEKLISLVPEEKRKLFDLLPREIKGMLNDNLRPFLRENENGRMEFRLETAHTIRQLYNHPSIVMWVPFNEGWGQFNAPEMTAMVRRLDPSRLVDEASGWFDRGGGDAYSIHNYFQPLKVSPQEKRCVVLSEFGGYSWQIPGHTMATGEFGYRMYHSKEQLTDAIEDLWMRDLIGNVEKGLCASVYTQVTDVEDETNGLMTYDREILKVDAERIRKINELLLKKAKECS